MKKVDTPTNRIGVIWWRFAAAGCASAGLPGDGGATFVIEEGGGRVQADADGRRFGRVGDANRFRYFVGVELQHLQVAQ